MENPTTEEMLAELRGPSAEQLDAAIAAANEAFAGWAGTPAVERAELLHELATRLRGRTDELARVMTLEGGRQEGLEAFQDTKHVHIETKIAPKDWCYPYGS